MKTNFILASIFLMIIISGISSADTFGTYILNEPVQLTFSCQNSTYLNISNVYIYPNGSRIINSETITTKTGNLYNYTIPKEYVTSIGTYVVNYHCDISGIDTPTPSSFLVDNSGYSLSTGESLILILTFVAIGILALVFFVYGIRAEAGPIKLFSLSLSVIFIVLLFGYGYSMFNQILGKYPAMASSLNSIYITLIVLLTCGGIGVVVWLIYFALNAWWKHRGLIE